MNKILRLVCRQADFKKIVSIGFFAAFFAVFLSAGMAQASFWDWFNLNEKNNSRQAAVADTVLPREIFKHWIHSHEEDTKDAKVFRPSDYNFPPSRGRDGFDIKEDGKFVLYSPGQDDRQVEFQGYWKSKMENEIIVYLIQRPPYTMHIISINNGVLKIRTSGSSNSSSSSVSSGASSSSSVQQYTLKVKISGAGQISGGGIRCKKSTDGKYSEGENWTCNIKVNKTSPATQITLTTETPSAQYEFGTWGDACRAAQRATSCTVTMTGNKTVSATFNKKAASGEGSGNTEGKYYDLTVTVSEGGFIASTDKKINCSSNSSPCKYRYKKNGAVTLKATPNANSGYVYAGGNNICLGKINRNNGVYTCKVKMTKDQTVTINFKASGATSSSSSSSISAKPMASTGAAEKITSTSVKLKGTVDTKGNDNVYFEFRYNKYGDLQTQTGTGLMYIGDKKPGNVSYGINVSGLTPGTKYDYFISVWIKKDGKWLIDSYVNGGIKSFTTLGAHPAVRP